MAEVESFATVETACGFAAIAWSDRGISGLRLPAHSAFAAEVALRRRSPDARRSAPPAPVAGVIADIVRYFEGETIGFHDVRIDLGAPEPFFARVYAEVRKLRWGETTTYGQVAKALGAEPQAARDVGVAMATNPIPLIVPCHRVLAAGGKVGGFSAPGGAIAKTRMLGIEGVVLAVAPRPSRRQRSSAQASLRFEGAP